MENYLGGTFAGEEYLMEFDEFTSDEEDDDEEPSGEVKRLTEKAGVEELNEVVDLYKQ
jgi:hypothetical protein